MFLIVEVVSMGLPKSTLENNLTFITQLDF